MAFTFKRAMRARAAPDLPAWAYTCGWRMSLRARIIDQDCELFTVKNGLIGIGTSRLVLRGSAIRAAYKEKAPHRRGALGKGIPVQQQRVRSVRLFYGGVRAASDEPRNRLCLFWVIKWRLRGMKPLPQKEAMEQLQGPPASANTGALLFFAMYRFASGWIIVPVGFL